MDLTTEWKGERKESVNFRIENRNYPSEQQRKNKLHKI